MKLSHTCRRNKHLGQGMTEYIIIVALIAVSAIAVYSLFGRTLRDQTAGLAMEMSGQDAGDNISTAKTNANTATTKAETAKNMGTYNGNN
ncbi:pilus assembly protein [Paraburkholderia strydomiana]|jgi:Flp pilus assembly pilin Flp|uniref:Flp family type IVb pilin n=1 Tax=Paraburkholderia strydomiana TaxID=1245417 RepID=UPI0038B70EF7